MQGPYTTITVDEYNRLAATIGILRRRIQRARELLESKCVEEALAELMSEADSEHWK